MLQEIHGWPAGECISDSRGRAFAKTIQKQFRSLFGGSKSANDEFWTQHLCIAGDQAFSQQVLWPELIPLSLRGEKTLGNQLCSSLSSFAFAYAGCCF